MKKEIESVNDELKDIIGVVFEDGCKIDDYFSCLITDNHLIDLGNRLFYDYEDDILEVNGGHIDIIN
jgi:hypothetical protein